MIERGNVSWWCSCGELMVLAREYAPEVKGWRFRCPRPGCNLRLTVDIGPVSEGAVMPVSSYAVCAECGVFMNCDEIDAVYLPERDEWTCGPCVREEQES